MKTAFIEYYILRNDDQLPLNNRMVTHLGTMSIIQREAEILSSNITVLNELIGVMC